MPTIAEIKLAHLVAAATASLATATTNAEVATAASDSKYAAIQATVRDAGYDSFEVGATTVSVPARLRSWSVEHGVSAPQRVNLSPPGWIDTGLGALVVAWKAAAAVTLKRKHELAGLKYLLDEAKGLQASYPPVSEDDVLPGLQSLLTAIQASMAAP